jgi:hypothetical protein
MTLTQEDIHVMTLRGMMRNWLAEGLDEGATVFAAVREARQQGISDHALRQAVSDLQAEGRLSAPVGES